MDKKHFEYISNDGITMIHAVEWIPDGEVKMILQISHGMIEYIERYDEFAEYMTSRGILVVGNDHLGHGNSIQSKEHYGYFVEKIGNKVLIKDIHRLRQLMSRKYPKLPYYLLGHSMGSFLARQYLCVYGAGLAGAIIVGTGCYPRSVLFAGLMTCETMAKAKGWRSRSKLLDALVFGNCNKRLPERRTDKDWLTKDEQIVDAYIAEERCGFMFTVNGYHTLFTGLYKLTVPSFLEKMPKELPVMFLAGEEDPIGNWGSGVRKVYNEFQESGMKNVSCILYPDDRHEILNELNREDIFSDIYKWLAD